MIRINKKLLTILLPACSVMCVLWLLPARQGVSAAKNDESSQLQSAAAEKNSQPADESKLLDISSNPAGQPIYISISEVFKDLKRPSVKFYHDKHTYALQQEGCEACHPKYATGEFIYSFPKNKNTRSAETLMNSYHERCIGCHNERAAAGKPSGAVTCGECHALEDSYHLIEYLPRMPEYYEPLRDTYHRDCIACHKEPAKSAHDAAKLDWKSFYIKQQEAVEAAWPSVVLDYDLHYRHEQALDKKCELCHLTFCEDEDKMVYVKGTESSCRDCHKDADEDNRLSYRHLSHNECIGCHLERHNENKKAGPYYCHGCHTGIEKNPDEMQYVPREERNQPQKVFIEAADARMKGVSFDHQFHELKTRTCQECHHDTLNKCSSCHTQKGSSEGGWIPLADAYHEPSSAWSCVGCHATKKQSADCAGCHSLIKTDLSESSCLTCHSGPIELFGTFMPLGAPALPEAEGLSAAPEPSGFDWMPFELPALASPEALLPDNTKEKLIISQLEKTYDPSELPHLQIVKKLTDISNTNRLARYFHAEQETICAGCHHYGPVEAKQTPPFCGSCHISTHIPQKNTPTLLGAYHRQCLGCHKAMGGDEKEKPQSCTGCHKEKEKPPAAVQTAAR